MSRTRFVYVSAAVSLFCALTTPPARAAQEELFFGRFSRGQTSHTLWAQAPDGPRRRVDLSHFGERFGPVCSLLLAPDPENLFHSVSGRKTTAAIVIEPEFALDPGAPNPVRQGYVTVAVADSAMRILASLEHPDWLTGTLDSDIFRLFRDGGRGDQIQVIGPLLDREVRENYLADIETMSMGSRRYDPAFAGLGKLVASASGKPVFRLDVLKTTFSLSGAYFVMAAGEIYHIDRPGYAVRGFFLKTELGTSLRLVLKGASKSDRLAAEHELGMLKNRPAIIKGFMYTDSAEDLVIDLDESARLRQPMFSPARTPGGR